MKKIIIFILALSLLFSFSCTNLDEDILDAIPAENFPENEAQAALITIQTYKELADLCDDAGWWFWAQEVTSDEVVFPVRLTDWDDGGKWRVLHQHIWDNETDAINSMWSHMFEGVFEANKAIEGLLPNIEELTAATTIAKLKALRAFYYYLLIDNYGNVPLELGFTDAVASPFTTDRAEIFDQLISDLEESLPLLPASANNFAVSKGMAFALIAKLYLNAEIYTGTAQWEKADAYCDSIIDLGKYMLSANPLEPFKSTNENAIENIFTIPFDENNLQGFRLHMRTLHYQHNLTFDMPVGTWNGFAAVEDHYNLYSNQDLRKEYFLTGPQFGSDGTPLIDGTTNSDVVIDPFIPSIVLTDANSFEEIRMSGARVVKYEVEKGAMENLNNDFPIFRYADILLMKAETQIRLGNNGDMWVNEIRNRAGLDNWSGTTLEMLLEERGREMFCEGHRRQDLIRFGKFGDSWWEKETSGADRTTFPIPQWAIDANPNLGG